MTDLKTIFNSIGIVLTIFGIWLTYKNSPLNEYISDGGNASTDFALIQSQTKRKNQRMALGVYIVLCGTIIQLISNFILTG